MAINEQVIRGRSKNALLSHFENTLSVPKIYIDADWNGMSVDVLAINRDGSGDVYAALLFPLTSFLDANGDPDPIESWKGFDELLFDLHKVTAHFKYVVAITEQKTGSRTFDGYSTRNAQMYAEDGIGRIGLLHIVLDEDDEPRIYRVVRAERFRAKVTELVDNYMHTHSADWEIRV